MKREPQQRPTHVGKAPQKRPIMFLTSRVDNLFVPKKISREIPWLCHHHAPPRCQRRTPSLWSFHQPVPLSLSAIFFFLISIPFLSRYRPINVNLIHAPANTQHMCVSLFEIFAFTQKTVNLTYIPDRQHEKEHKETGIEARRGENLLFLSLLHLFHDRGIDGGIARSHCIGVNRGSSHNCMSGRGLLARTQQHGCPTPPLGRGYQTRRRQET